ncbi:MAG TPA: hypothetical protein VEX69_06315 [Candidatus Limnocylindria bacterium]|nr:hypothetical protein [Candidatus Limnocylindria bacterium]
MKFSGLHRWLASVLSLFLLSLLLVGCGQSPQANEKPNSGAEKPGLLSGIFDSTKPITIPEGTDLTVVLDQTISTASSRSGDSFRATLTSPVVIDGKTVLPKDAPVTGHIVESVPSGRLKGVARLDLTLDSVEVNSKTYDLATDDEGRRGKNHNKRNGVLIGGGAGLGAIIGGVAGGGVGAVVGSAVGAGAGTAGAAYTGKKDIRVPAETTLTFRLTRAVTIPVKS